MHYPCSLNVLQSSEIGTHPLSVGNHLNEHYKQMRLSQSHVLQPKSGGGSVFLSENIQRPSKRSYPVQQLRQNPSNISHVLHCVSTYRHIPFSSKYDLYAHFKQTLSSHSAHS